MSSTNGCNDSEKAFIKKIKKMTDAQLQEEWTKQNRDAQRTAAAMNWYIAERQSLFVGLELLDRGYDKETIWVKR